MQTKFVSRSLAFAAAVFSGAVLALSVSPTNAYAQGGPSGSYRNSCRLVKMDKGGYLEALCARRDGTLRRSRIRVSECKGRDIVNYDGRLVCDNNGRGNNDRPNNRYPDRGNNKGRDGKYDDRRDRHDRHDDRYDRNDRYDNDRNRNYSRGLIIYDGTRFSGRSLSIRDDYSNLSNTGFNDKASSIRILGRGTWRVCTDRSYGGKCVNVSSDVSDLGRLGMGNKISSIRRVR